MTWLVYILESLSTGRLYTGITNDLTARLDRHNKGKGAKATRAGRPWSVVYYRVIGSKSSALKEEARVKKLTRAKKLDLILGASRP